MGYFTRLHLDLLEAYAGFLRSRRNNKVAYYTSILEPLDEKIAELRSKLRVEASHGVVFDGRSFTHVDAPAPSVESSQKDTEKQEAPDAEAEPVAAEADAAESGAKEADAAESEKNAIISTEAHPELSGEVIVFTDSEVELLNNLESEFSPTLLESSEMAMKTLDRTRIVVRASELNVNDHIGMSVTPILEDEEAQKNLPPAYFVVANTLPEEMSMQLSHGKHREMVKVLVVHAETHGVMALMTPAENRWILETRRSQ